MLTPDKLLELQKQSQERNAPRLKVEKERVAKLVVIKMVVKKVRPPLNKKKIKPNPEIDWEKVRMYAKAR